MYNAAVKRLLQGKNREVISVTSNTTVFDAINKMAEYDIGALVVLEGTRMVGIITERDYLTKLILKGKHSHETFVGEVMTTKVLSVRPDQTIEDCMALMTERHIRHLPVIDGDTILGIVSIRDVVAHLIADKDFMIQQLENYIMDRRPGIDQPVQAV